MARMRPDHRAVEVVLVRRGETLWSREGKQTGRTDVPLTERGRRQATNLSAYLQPWRFDLVLASPSTRHLPPRRVRRRGPGAEGPHGVGLRRVRRPHPGTDPRGTPSWSLWTHGASDGKTPDEVGVRVDRIIAEVRQRSR